MAQESGITQHSSEEEDEGENPDDQGKTHGTQDDSLLIVLLGETLDLLKEARDGTLNSGLAYEQLTFIDRLECESIDDLTWSGAEQDADPSCMSY